MPEKDRQYGSWCEGSVVGTLAPPFWTVMVTADSAASLAIAGFKNFKNGFCLYEIIVHCNNKVLSSEFRRPCWSSKNIASHNIAFKIQTHLIRSNYMSLAPCPCKILIGSEVFSPWLGQGL